MSDTEMTESSKRSADEAGFEEPSTEELESANYAISRCAFAAREHLIRKAKSHFRRRNSREITEEELTNTFNTLRDRIVNDDADSESSFDGDVCDDIDNLQADCDEAYETARDLGRRHREHLIQTLPQKAKRLCVEELGAESEDLTSAVFYNLKHQIYGAMLPVDDADDNDEEDYEPTDAEKEAAEEEQDFTESENQVSFDLPTTCHVSEELLESAVEKFYQHTGRAPTEQEFEALVESFKGKLLDADLSSGDDYEPSDVDDSEDESVEEDFSLCRQTEVVEQMDHLDMQDTEPEKEEQQTSSAFQYMQELGKPEEEHEEQEDQETSKMQQAEEHGMTQLVCA